MTSIKSVQLETSDPASAEAFYSKAFGIDARVGLCAAEGQSSGFRGFTLSLIVPDQESVGEYVQAAVDAGARMLKPARKQLWGGFSSVVEAPDGAIWKLATNARSANGTASRQIDEVVLLLGVADVRASKRLYAERGLNVAKSYGGKYVEFEAAPDTVKLGLYKRAALAKDASVPPEGSGSHRIVIGGDTDSFTDLDGFVWRSGPA